MIVVIALFLFALLMSIVLALIEAFIIHFLLPLTGIPYDPSYWQAFAFVLLVNIVISWAKIDVTVK